MSLLQRISEALRLKPRSSANDPQSVAALDLIEKGQAAEKSGSFDKARDIYARAVELAPRLAKAHMNLGNAYVSLFNIERAMECYRTAVALEPNSAPAHYNLGNGYWYKNEFELALRSYLTATDLDRSFVMPWVAIANMCANVGRTEEAIDACRHAIAIDENHAEAYFVLALIYKSMENVEDEKVNLKRTLELDPSHFSAHLCLAINADEALDFEEGIRIGEILSEKFPSSVIAQTQFVHRLSWSPATGAAELFRRLRIAGGRIEKAEEERGIAHVPSDDATRALRIGFVSADFFGHAVYYFIEPILEKLSEHKNITLFGYYNNTVISAETDRIRGHFHFWRDVKLLPDNVFANGILADKIDILIDLSGFTDGNRLSIFARKLAPIQASWIGYPGTTGMNAMDYYIADPRFLPRKDFADQFVEKLVYLPSTAPYRPIATAPAINGLPALDLPRFTFGSFNRANKIHMGVVALWARVLHAVPSARMILAAMSNQGQIDTLKRWFMDEGIDDSRLVFERRSSIDSYLRRHHEVDLCLDTFPYSGGTTIRHAIWMGVPTVTIAGSTPASRQASSIMELMDLGGFVASSEDEFVALAKSWACRLDELAGIRADMRDRFSRSPLGKPELVASAFVKATRIMWQRWCAGEPPEFIDVSEPDE